MKTQPTSISSLRARYWYVSVIYAIYCPALGSNVALWTQTWKPLLSDLLNLSLSWTGMSPSANSVHLLYLPPLCSLSFCIHSTLSSSSLHHHLSSMYRRWDVRWWVAVGSSLAGYIASASWGMQRPHLLSSHVDICEISTFLPINPSTIIKNAKLPYLACMTLT